MVFTGDRSGWRFKACAAIVLVALLAGGTSRPLNDLALFLAAMPLLFLALANPSAELLAWTVKLAWGLFGLALLQLVPLPPSIWTSLPGRELAASSLLASGQHLGWRPLALDPGAAAIGFLTLVAPLLLHAAVTRLKTAEVRRLLALVAGFALFSALLGIFQRVTGGLSLYQTEHLGTGIGLFANRNHHADLLIAGILLLIALPDAKYRRQFRLLATAAIVLLAFAVIATTSRAGIALSIPAALAALFAIWRPTKSGWQWLLLGALALAFSIELIPAFTEIFERFWMAGDDQRISMARDSLVATRAMWPFGSGYGSFVPVFMAYEDLDLLEARYVVAAHNDYLQLALEGGIAGVLTAIAALAAMAVMAWTMVRNRATQLAWAAWGVAAMLLIHSAVDFPLRTGTLAVIFALCTAASQNLSTQLRDSRKNAN